MPIPVGSNENIWRGQFDAIVHYCPSSVCVLFPSRMLADVAEKVVDRSTFLTKLMKDEGDSDARVMWKYSCSSKD